MWVWVNTYRYIFSGMNIHLPAILGFTRYQGFDPCKSSKDFFVMGEYQHWPIPTSHTNTPRISLHLFTSLTVAGLRLATPSFVPLIVKPAAGHSGQIVNHIATWAAIWRFLHRHLILSLHSCDMAWNWMLTTGNGTQNRSRVIQKPAAYGGAGCGALWLELHRTRTFKLRGFQRGSFDCLDGLICRIYRSLWFMMIYDFFSGQENNWSRIFRLRVFCPLPSPHAFRIGRSHDFFCLEKNLIQGSLFKSTFWVSL